MWSNSHTIYQLLIQQIIAKGANVVSLIDQHYRTETETRNKFAPLEARTPVSARRPVAHVCLLHRHFPARLKRMLLVAVITTFYYKLYYGELLVYNGQRQTNKPATDETDTLAADA